MLETEINYDENLKFVKTDNSPKWNAARRMAADYDREMKLTAHLETSALIDFVYKVRFWNDATLINDFDNMRRAGALIKYESDQARAR